jgi:hypothetical protein
VLDVLVGNTVLTGVVRDLQLCRLPCPSIGAQVTLPTLGNLHRDPGREPGSLCEAM